MSAAVEPVLKPETEAKAAPSRTPYLSFSTFRYDFISSLVVFLIALPLCMGVAIASGVSPALGIITGIVGGLVVGSIGGSPLQVSGPAAGLSVIIFEMVHKLGIEKLGPVLVLAGVLQLAGGFLKLGRWFRAISPAVIYGMLSGIGILIVGAQFHVMVDDKPRASGLANLAAIPLSLEKALFPPDGAVHHLAGFVGLATLITILVWNRFRPKALRVLPGTLIGVVVGTSLAAMLELPIRRVDLPANLFSGFHAPDMAWLSNFTDPAVLIAAATIAIVASAETLLSASAVDRMHTGPQTNYDRELGAQGIGNAICGFLGALPMTGVIVRSSANVQAGAKSRLSSMMHGAWLLALVMVFPSVLRLIPTASLAAILVFTGFKLVEVHHVKRLAKYGKFPLFIYAATVLGIVVQDLLTGVVIGVALSIVKLLLKATHLDVRVATKEDSRQVEITLLGTATFLRLPKLNAAFDALPDDKIVHLNIDGLHYVDHTCYEMLQSTATQRAQRGGALLVSWEQLATRFHLQPATAER